MEYKVAIVEQRSASIFRNLLKQAGYFLNKRKVIKLANGSVSLPVTDEFIKLSTSTEHKFHGISFTIDVVKQEMLKPRLPRDYLIDCIKSLCEHYQVEWNEDMKRDLPKHWEKHGDFLMLPWHCFLLEIWKIFGIELWQAVAMAFGCNCVAKKNSINCDTFRSPKVQMLLGENTWCERVDNAIRYTYDVTKCMFSVGNITEKLRIASINCQNEIVVDLYAGIGYFTLPFLVHCGAKFLYACEWNPYAIVALKRNLELNRVSNRCLVLFGDNKEVCPRNVADRVNVGLIPSSEQGWYTACAALKVDKGGILHIHGTVSSKYNAAEHDADQQRNSATTSQTTLSMELVPKCDSSQAICRSCDDTIIKELCSKSDDFINTMFNIGNVSSHQGDTGLGIKDHISLASHPHCTVSMDHNISNGEIILVNASTTCFSSNKFQKRQKLKNEWCRWTEEVCIKIKQLLLVVHDKNWNVSVTHIEHVKSYAPHVDHIVVDLYCSPLL